jgi:CubicO group peptidase (beta-lactamase class C family)
MALLTPLLSACGGGGNEGDDLTEKVIKTDIKPDDWPVAAPASQGIADSIMQAFLNEGAATPFMYSMLVVRNGQLIGERYANGAESSDLRSVASVTKTVSSLLIGQAIADGKIASTADTLAKLLPNELAKTPNPYAADITLQQLLNMTGGQLWNESLRQLDATTAPDMTAFALALPSDGGIRGKTFSYSTAASHLISPILRNAYGIDELALATANLFTPLGIKRCAWSRDASGMVHGSFGLQLRTRDVMKLALMSLQGGQWQGRTVEPATWISKSLTPAILGLGEEGALKAMGYGNLWWSGTIAGYRIHMAAGYGGQYAMLVPELNLAIATAADINIPFRTAGSHQETIMNIIGRFLQAVRG